MTQMPPTHFLGFAHLRGTNILVKNVNARVFTNQMWTDGRMDDGQRPIIKPHQSNQCSITRKTAPPPCGHCHDDWANNVISRVHVIQLTGTIFELNSRIKKTNVLTKFHEN
ncbi:hypothetical protein DPMN_121512 [Dreissena polymorpha]|uniref:Uncharacterized protein n=1 Tax=Dreissena polymorpha TaxID=45954 RepID=A0A9D4JT64_DREPO|nr:hypothetical protein DPMN_121512 [Dreissena polymorpha]